MLPTPGTEGHLVVKEELATGTQEMHLSPLRGGPGLCGHPDRRFVPTLRVGHVPVSDSSLFSVCGSRE